MGNGSTGPPTVEAVHRGGEHSTDAYAMFTATQLQLPSVGFRTAKYQRIKKHLGLDHAGEFEENHLPNRFLASMFCEAGCLFRETGDPQ